MDVQPVNDARGNKQDELRVLSLFSGCGGMDLGFEGDFHVLAKSINTHIHPQWASENITHNPWIKLPKTNFRTIFANDISAAAKASWVPYFVQRGLCESTFREQSIVDLVREHDQTPSIFPEAHVVIGGFPCQDFSVAGKRLGFASHRGHHGDLLKSIDDPMVENRGSLYIWMKRVIEIVQPKAFVAENVKGLVSMRDVKKIIENDFRNIGSGYLVVNARVLSAARYGVPQSRERIFFIGFRRDALTAESLKALLAPKTPEIYNPYPRPTHGPIEQSLFEPKDIMPYVTVGDYINDLPEPKESIDLSHQSYSKAKWYGRHCQGQTEVDLAGLGPTIRAEHHGNIEFRRLSLEHGGRYHQELNKGMTERRLSVRECARIQTFPDDFRFVRKTSELGGDYKLSASEGYKLVGNAVPPLLAFHIAWRLQELWPILFEV